MPFKDTKEGQTHYCRACEEEARGIKSFELHTCKLFISSTEVKCKHDLKNIPESEKYKFCEKCNNYIKIITEAKCEHQYLKDQPNCIKCLHPKAEIKKSFTKKLNKKDMKNHKHNYYKNEDGRMECARCGLLKSTIEETPPTEAKCDVCKKNIAIFHLLNGKSFCKSCFDKEELQEKIEKEWEPKAESWQSSFYNVINKILETEEIDLKLESIDQLESFIATQKQKSFEEGVKSERIKRKMHKGWTH